MNRREFLKLGSLFAAAMVINTNPILNAAAKLADTNPDTKVLLYIIKNRKTGKWHVKATKYTDIAKKRLSLNCWEVDTFRPLQIVDNSEATEVRNKLWKLHIGTKVPNSIIDVVSFTQGGLKAGPKTGAIWAQRFRDNDPRAIKLLQARIEGARLWQELYPEEHKAKLAKLYSGYNEWMEDMMQNHPEEWQAKIDALTSGYVQWCKDNPELKQQASHIGGMASLKKRKQDPETFLNTVSAYGKKGMRGLRKLYKENPELYAKHHKKACDAASAKATETRLANIDKLYNALPDTFTRQYAYDLAKQLKTPYNTATSILGDKTLTVKSNDRINTGGGRGSSLAIWTKL